MQWRQGNWVSPELWLSMQRCGSNMILPWLLTQTLRTTICMSCDCVSIGAVWAGCSRLLWFCCHLLVWTWYFFLYLIHFFQCSVAKVSQEERWFLHRYFLNLTYSDAWNCAPSCLNKRLTEIITETQPVVTAVSTRETQHKTHAYSIFTDVK